jgi:hypothetical protein
LADKRKSPLATRYTCFDRVIARVFERLLELLIFFIGVAILHHVDFWPLFAFASKIFGRLMLVGRLAATILMNTKLLRQPLVCRQPIA